MMAANYDLEAHIADAKANPRPINGAFPDLLRCAAHCLQNGSTPMPYYAQDVRTAADALQRILDKDPNAFADIAP